MSEQKTEQKTLQEEYELLHERAKRLIEFADFLLGGTLSAESELREIPSKASSTVKARHLAALRDSVRAIDARTQEAA